MEHISIKENNLIATFPLHRDRYWLVCEKGTPGQYTDGIWWLSEKIDRSYKGKGPDIAVPSIRVPLELVEGLSKQLDVVWD